MTVSLTEVENFFKEVEEIDRKHDFLLDNGGILVTENSERVQELQRDDSLQENDEKIEYISHFIAYTDSDEDDTYDGLDESRNEGLSKVEDNKFEIVNNENDESNFIGQGKSNDNSKHGKNEDSSEKDSGTKFIGPQMPSDQEKLQNDDKESAMVKHIKENIEDLSNKLLTLSVSKLSFLQYLQCEIAIRHCDWLRGALSDEYMLDRLNDSLRQMQQFEAASVPHGWLCHWDRESRSYYYESCATGERQWEYPQASAQDHDVNSQEGDCHNTRKRSRTCVGDAGELNSADMMDSRSCSTGKREKQEIDPMAEFLLEETYEAAKRTELIDKILPTLGNDKTYAAVATCNGQSKELAEAEDGEIVKDDRDYSSINQLAGLLNYDSDSDSGNTPMKGNVNSK